LTAAFKTFKEPSPIQACTWPPALAGKDVVGIAETGRSVTTLLSSKRPLTWIYSGKTLAFGIPALNALINSSTSTSSNITTLVVAPTRELAIQTHDALSGLGKTFGIASVAIFGGVPKDGQIRMLKASLKQGSDGLLTRIVVGTPGRILDLMNDGALNLSG
jgi:ATP-dependent RNA helicase DBP3